MAGRGPRGSYSVGRARREQILVAAEAADPAGVAHDLYVARYARVVAALTAAFQRSSTAGFLHADLDYEAIARECVAVADGLQLQWVLTGGRIDLIGLIRNHLERLAPRILRSGRHVDLSGEMDRTLMSA
ncbi:TetR family transcriptional regulator C-terminal domain-containing protein [Paractinoplanes durhamensis]|nr:TetR family transcriptional regulator C-terminal domain-containing protein [Actinoplanes durhamensis]